MDHIFLHVQHPQDFRELHLQLSRTYSLACQVYFAQRSLKLSRLIHFFLLRDRLGSCVRILSVNLLAPLSTKEYQQTNKS
jgi:hypothetical protein